MKLFRKIRNNFPSGWVSRVILGLMLLLALVGAFFSYRLARRLVAGTTAFTLPGDPVIATDDSDEGEEGIELNMEAETPEPEVELPDPDPWDGTSRVNVLVMGLDLRDVEGQDQAPRSDTMILLSMDPLNNTAAAIAIPRDMWVPIPGFDHNKINTAYRFGELYNIPGGGPELASQTVEALLGVPVHFYVQIDFQAFVDFIDHIKGLRMTFDEPYTIDRRGKWNTVTLEPGTYALPGEYVLAYARDRHSEGDDFDRSDRQLEVIMLIRQRILEFDMLPNLVMKAPAIYEDLSTGIRTNMSLNQLIQLAWKAREIPKENIEMVVIGPEHITFAKSPDGLDIVRPIPDRIRLLRDETFSSGGVLGPVGEEDLPARVAEEAPSVMLLNASYQPDLGERTADWLRNQGFQVVGIGTSQSTSVSTVDLQGPAPYGLRFLVDAFGMTPGHIDHRYAPDAEMDLVLTLGDDWANNNPLP
jgi:polyisoprenyl-teichoic acid--peptidoglycan teichoic acid transferase